MTALATQRLTKVRRFSALDLPATAEQVFRGGLAVLDMSTQRVRKGAADTDLLPIGFFDPAIYDKDGSYTPVDAELVTVRLFREITAAWFVNATAGDAVAAGNVFGLAYILDDQTVASNDATNTRSVAGRIWAFDATKGVLVEPAHTAVGHLTALDF